MTRPESGPAAGRGRERLVVALLAIVALEASILAFAAWQGAWLVYPAGHLIPYDYVNPYAAGRLALEGRAADAYDYAAHKAAEVAALGHDFTGYFPWPYPPPSLLVAAPFATLPYLPSFAAWIAVTGLAYLLAIRAAAGGGGLAVLAALAWPAAAWNLSVGQNGFLTAALFAGGLAALPVRPAFAGLALGLLAYKPQLGLLIPVALAAGGHWRSFAAAGATVAAAALVSVPLLGLDTWAAFLRSVAVTNEVVMVAGQGDFGKMQTLYGILRNAGAGSVAAWSAQAGLALAAAAWVAAVWRGQAPLPTRAATLVCGALLATPYAFIYDLVLLVVPLAFLARPGLDRTEIVVTALAAAIVFAVPFAPPAIGFGAIGLVTALVVLRAHRGPEPERASGLLIDTRAEGSMVPLAGRSASRRVRG